MKDYLSIVFKMTTGLNVPTVCFKRFKKSVPLWRVLELSSFTDCFPSRAKSLSHYSGSWAVWVPLILLACFSWRGTCALRVSWNRGNWGPSILGLLQWEEPLSYGWRLSVRRSPQYLSHTHAEFSVFNLKLEEMRHFMGMEILDWDLKGETALCCWLAPSWREASTKLSWKWGRSSHMSNATDSCCFYWVSLMGFPE